MTRRLAQGSYVLSAGITGIWGSLRSRLRPLVEDRRTTLYMTLIRINRIRLGFLKSDPGVRAGNVWRGGLQARSHIAWPPKRVHLMMAILSLRLRRGDRHGRRWRIWFEQFQDVTDQITLRSRHPHASDFTAGASAHVQQQTAK